MSEVRKLLDTMSVDELLAIEQELLARTKAAEPLEDPQPQAARAPQSAKTEKAIERAKYANRPPVRNAAEESRRQNPREPPRGRIEEATITAIIERTSGKKRQVDFGKDMTALIDTGQVVREE